MPLPPPPVVRTPPAHGRSDLHRPLVRVPLLPPVGRCLGHPRRFPPSTNPSDAFPFPLLALPFSAASLNSTFAQPVERIESPRLHFLALLRPLQLPFRASSQRQRPRSLGSPPKHCCVQSRRFPPPGLSIQRKG